MIDFTKIYHLKGLKPKYKGHTNFYDCCDLTKKVYLIAHILFARHRGGPGGLVKVNSGGNNIKMRGRYFALQIRIQIGADAILQ